MVLVLLNVPLQFGCLSQLIIQQQKRHLDPTICSLLLPSQAVVEQKPAPPASDSVGEGGEYLYIRRDERRGRY
jgi:hypothetical protein